MYISNRRTTYEPYAKYRYFDAGVLTSSFVSQVACYPCSARPPKLKFPHHRISSELQASLTLQQHKHTMAEQTEYVTLVSNDGYEFKVLRSAACIAGAIKRMLDPTSNFSEALNNRCTFENIKCVSVACAAPPSPSITVYLSSDFGAD